MNCKIYKHEALQQSMKSSYKQQMGAVVVYRGKVVGRGFNKVYSTGTLRLDGKHAEREALRNTTSRYRNGSTVYVCRLMKNGTLGLAKPCPACQTVMKKIGVKYVWYSSDNGWIKMTLCESV